MSAVHPLDVSPAATGSVRCRYCNAKLDASRGDHVNRHVCAECRKHPSYRTALATVQAASASNVDTPRHPAPKPIGDAESFEPRPFTPADKALIRKVHRLVPPQQLLDLLNERLVADLGATAVRYTMAKLRFELAGQIPVEPASDWAGIRKRLKQAASSGLLKRITPQLLEDFAVIYQLTPQQVARLKDIVLAAHSQGEPS